MGKRYITTADDVVDNLTSNDGSVPLSARQGKILNDAKVAKAQGSAQAGKFLKVGADGNVTLGESSGGVWGSITGTLSNQTDLNNALNGKEPVITKNDAFNKSFGTAADTVCEGNDARLENARTPTSHASTSTRYGAADASNYGHAKASSTTPNAAGTAAVGSETGSFARGDHVHPAQTSVSGNAGGLSGMNTTIAELNYVHGVTSNIQTQLNSKQATLSAGTNVSISSNKVSVTGTATATNGSTALMTSGGLFKRVQSGTADPASGFSGTPVAGDIYIKY